MSRAAILRLSCLVFEDADALSVLGDAVLQYDWYDSLLFGAYGIDADECQTLAARPTPEWAAKVGAVILCGTWVETVWIGMLSSWTGASQGSGGKVTRYTFGMPTAVVPPGGTVRVQQNPETTIRCLRLIIIASAPGLMVTMVRGDNVNMIVGAAVPVEQFGPEQLTNVEGLPTLSPANSVMIGYFNPTDKPISVNASFSGVGVPYEYGYASTGRRVPTPPGRSFEQAMRDRLPVPRASSQLTQRHPIIPLEVLGEDPILRAARVLEEPGTDLDEDMAQGLGDYDE